MADAKIDGNGRPSMTGVLNTNGTTITQVLANPINNGLKIDDGTTGTVGRTTNANIDGNSKQTATVVASDGSGQIINLLVTSDGRLLVNSN